ncbi:hypothetical protein BD324DRAFT_631553 [Kockovaella imperatae]|uniref:Uncharacterized protein n=1 Tax=Kockovaella imperatae TaxID=4999 RepID=A0A1Y1UCM2_9TREE|nr:hypothetical protein BD324DRAFT_631553 [Kockovaella imperatae]ORX35759.1 hypothetical protein BD324DRAFT_631553 [Kockovaella imperatae]
MAPLLRAYFAPRQRSLLSSLFAVTFLGAVLVVAFPCPAKPIDRLLGRKRIEGVSFTQEQEQEIIVMMNERSKRKFLPER